MGKDFVIVNLTFFLFLTGILVNGETCPQQKDGSASTNEKARNLAGSGTFYIEDEPKKNEQDDDHYQYTINLCASDNFHLVAVAQKDLSNAGVVKTVGYFKDAKKDSLPPRVVGGTDWLMITYFGEKYDNHCGKSPRKSIFFIQCDRSADTHAERQPKIVEEYKPDNKDDEEFCYYLFEMRHDGVCPPQQKTKISPGSVFIIIIVIIGVLYLVLGFLYQRFIVGAKGMEQIPNYLMWREFGTLQADGCNFICRAKGARQPTRYKPMDDAIADDEDFNVEKDDENDDAMLPM